VVPAGLRAHWAQWLGAPVAESGCLASAVTVVAAAARERPGWDGRVRPVAGLVDPRGAAVVSLPPDHAGWARDLLRHGGDLDRLLAALPDRLGRPDATAYRAVYRWSTNPAALPAAGRWVPVEDPRVPAWLRPFGGQALVALDPDGRTYLAGVGVKRHDPHVQELAVGTEPAARGQGLARRLVAQAARTLLDAGVVPTYLHDPVNAASARVAEAAGFPDRGWRALGMADRQEAAEAAGGG
jgi:GNAT superfamily N-acetyltransferase